MVMKVTWESVRAFEALLLTGVNLSFLDNASLGGYSETNGIGTEKEEEVEDIHICAHVYVASGDLRRANEDMSAKPPCSIDADAVLACMCCRAV